MKRSTRVWLVWLALFVAYAVPVLLFEPFTRFGVPVWLGSIIGVVIGFALAVVAEWLVWWRETRQWRRAAHRFAVEAAARAIEAEQDESS